MENMSTSSKMIISWSMNDDCKFEAQTNLTVHKTKRTMDLTMDPEEKRQKSNDTSLEGSYNSKVRILLSSHKPYPKV